MTTDISFNSIHTDRVISVKSSLGDARIAIEAPNKSRTEFAFLSRKEAQKLVNALAEVFPGLEPLKPPTAQEVFDALPMGAKFTVTESSGREARGVRIKLANNRYYSSLTDTVMQGHWTAEQTITEVK